LLFISLSLLFIPLAGIQDDEALFAVPFWESLGRQFEIRAFHHGFPLMLISYLGTVKTAIYWILFKFLPPNVWTVRLPMVLAGGLTVFLFYLLAKRVSPFAALCGALLLATDPVFLLTNTFDWGPVALEHLLLVAGCLAAVRFAETKQPKILGLSFFLFGLALWNKALFIWALSGVTVGALLTFKDQFRALLSPRNARIAALAFLLGSFPFILYNIRHSGATLGENARLDTESFARKWLQIKNAANGNALFTFIAEEDYVEPPKPITSGIGRSSLWIHDLLGTRRESGAYYIFGALLVLVPLWRPSNAARFSLIFLLVAATMMILTKDAGGSAHHTILLWPFPVMFSAVALARIPWRWLAALIAVAMVGMNLLVLNQYLYQMERNGAATNFTDALFPIAQELAAFRDRHIYVIDWGIIRSVQLSSRGQFPVRFASDPLMTDTPDEIERTQLNAMLTDPQGVFVGHVKSREAFVGVGERLARYAGAHGFRREVISTITDSNGRPVFEVFRFERM